MIILRTSVEAEEAGKAVRRLENEHELHERMDMEQVAG
jgi:hypothetical protein